MGGEQPDSDHYNMAVHLGRLQETARRFTEFRYDFDDAFAFPLRGVNVPQAGPQTNNCCTFVEALMVGAWQDAYADFAWSPKRHHQMMIMSRDDFFSPVTAAVEAGLAVPVREGSAPHPWTIVQGWREQWNRGHTFLIVAHHPGSDRVLTIVYRFHRCASLKVTDLEWGAL